MKLTSYDKLRPWTNIERCACKSVTQLVLVDLLTDNPIHCFTCKNEIDAESIGLSESLVDEVACWFAISHALYELWLQSGEYEDYAKQNLTDKNSQVNIDGMAVAKKLSKHYKTYYLWFYDTDDGSPNHCPNCYKPLDQNVKFATGKCDACNIMV
ncbi:DUF2310 family Zn-ribbon-containing protein [Solemya pervernicosa gill symbiont]|uniref:DUF2310 family Zn-ribbon-containing protein n=1 Tax=Solemya pervernicosa gill symbiont TaxID=642797 RepID=UPI0010825D97|nr:DUF2310 family Zn-ribbon-containing protein [Solemya pervernicosa gill symbiont]